MADDLDLGGLEALRDARFFDDRRRLRLCPDERALIDRIITRLRASEAATAKAVEALTPSGDTKAAYHGEFKFQVTQWRENEDPDSDDEMEEYLADFTVPWTTVKKIMAAIRARAALPSTPPVAEEKL